MTTTSHTNCAHAATKAARAKCRRDAAKPAAAPQPTAPASYWPDDILLEDRSDLFSGDEDMMYDCIAD
jgi:hypothetical protein